MASTPMASRRSSLPPALTTALSVVVLLQSILLMWLILAAPADRDRVFQAVRQAPALGTVVEACEAALS